ncbi:helix-turn-helix domain-containing protein [Burkholderia sp. BKH01]
MIDRQGFSAAARRLGVAASSVVRRIDRLETQPAWDAAWV